MPDKNKMKVFKRTNMTIFETCTLCKHGEIPSNATWGYCKHPGHFYDNLRHKQRLPGVAHAAMGCDDFELMHKASREMAELGPYLKLLPIHEAVVEEVGVEEEKSVDENIDYEKLAELLKSAISIETEKEAYDFIDRAITLAEETWPKLTVENAEKKMELIANLLSIKNPEKFLEKIKDFEGESIEPKELLEKIKDSEGENIKSSQFEEACRVYREKYKNIKDAQFEADFEEAGRLTDSAVAEIHADDAEDNE